MKTKKIFLLLASMLLLVMMAVTASAAEYEVKLPAGHSTSGNKYPVVFVLPQNGLKANAQDLALAQQMTNAGLDSVVVIPEFEEGMDLRAEMKAIVAEVDGDASLHAIANAKQRALVGIGTGGYLAYVLGMTGDDGNVLAAPELFAGVASIRGNFADNATNPWLKKYGSVYDKLAKARASFTKFYTYMDAPVDDAWTNMPGSTNDLGSMFIQAGTTADYHEYTARLGEFSDDFVKESAKRIGDRLSRWMVRYTFYTSMSSVIVTASDKYAEIPYSVMGLPTSYDGAVEHFAPNYSSIPMKITVSAYDSQTGEKLITSDPVDGYARYFGGSSGTIQLKNVADGKTVALKMHAEALGYTFEIATGNMVFLKDPVIDGDYQEFDLMGDWYFKYTGRESKKVGDLLSSKEYESWHVVQPTLGWWSSGFGGLGSGYETGNSYYVREFVLPEGFDTKNPVISLGYVDDCCEVFINGKRVGGTGITANGEIADPSAVTWDLYSAFEFDASILKHNGEKNTIVVRDVNNSGGGGWYAGPISLYSKEAFDAQSGGGNSFTDRFYEETYYSDAIGQDMEYLIYLPKDYFTAKGDRYYPTLYLLHQFSSTHYSYMGDGIDKKMEDAINEGMFDQMIVVIPNSDGMSWWKGKWENMVLNDLIPHIDANYRTIDDARYRFTSGCSMGGLGASTVALTNPDYFSGMAGFYGAYDYGGWFGKVDPIKLLRTESDEYIKNYALAFICGNQDSYRFGKGHITMNQILEEKGIDHYFFIENGEHDSSFYLPYFQDTIKYTWTHMYDDAFEDANKPNLKTMAYANFDKSANGATLIFAANEKIEKYFNQIPASSYTQNETPALSIPLRITVTQNGQKYQLVIRDHKLAQGSNVNVFDGLTGADFTPISRAAGELDLSKRYDCKIEAAIFDEEWVELGRIPKDLLNSLNLPNTGDNSNIVLFALLLAASVAMIAVLGKKKAHA